MPLGFGIVGAGMISRFHAKAIGEIADAKLIGCCSRTLGSAQSLAVETECKAFESLSALLGNPEIDVVTICTPSGDHLEPALAAMSAGKHVLVEKPLEVTAARCDQLIDAASRNGVLLSTIFPSRFHPCWQLLRDAISTGRFGKIVLADAFVKWYRTQQYYDSGDWRGTWALDGGGALMNQAIHSVDLLLWLMGAVASVNARIATLAHERIEVEDVAVANLQFQNGALGVIEATTASFPGQLKRIEIHGSNGTAIIEEDRIAHWQFAEMTSRDEEILKAYSRPAQSAGGSTDPKAISQSGHTELFRDFINSLRSGRIPQSAGLEGRRSVELIEAIYRAAKSGAQEKL